MASRQIEQRIDDALLATATWAGFLYARRRMRRAVSRVATGAVVITAGAIAVPVVGALAWKRSRARSAS